MKKAIILFIGVCLICLGVLNENEKENNELYNADVINKEENTLSMMLETEFNSGKYEETKGSSWPAEGYLFNSTLSKCKNGSSLSWDNDKKQVIFEGNTKDDCYVYFDVFVPTISEVCSSKDTLSNCIKMLYTKPGENNLYLHDDSLENGAKDNSYRYAGSSDTTNNFVCFGYDSKDGSCPTDYLYRIIGVFGDEVKLIKYDYAKTILLGTDGDYANYYNDWDKSNSYGTNKGENTKSDIGVYYWNYKADSLNYKNSWGNSLLNKINLNTNYLNNIGTMWSNKIANHLWKIGGNSYNNIASKMPSNAYQNEITIPANEVTYNAKIGLLYVSDYAYSAESSAWTTFLHSYNIESIKNINWMYMGLYEWTISRRSDDSNLSFGIGYDGDVGYGDVFGNGAIRPTFYLNSNVTYLSGSGTKIEPILIN